MVPLSYDGEISIPVALMAGFVEESLKSGLPVIMTVLLLFVAVLSTVVTYVKPEWALKRSFIKSLFFVHPVWLLTRIVGFILAGMTLMKIGPEWVWSGATGGLLLYDLMPLLFSIFIFAGLFLPLLLNFGLLELLGTLLDKVMKPLFTLPGRSSIDCLASWMGDGTIGVLLTNNQYEQGFYTKREAAVIGTTFSVVSITFSIVILSYLDLDHLFVPYYITIVVAGLAAALIMPRIPSLSRKANIYMVENKEMKEPTDSGEGRFRLGLTQAVKRAKKNADLRATVSSGVKNVFDMWFGVLPVVMALGTIAVIIAETTPVFDIIGMPFIPILQLLQVPEATEASQTMVIGFADMFLPAVIGSGIESEMTRFVIACVSVTQLIYMSEIGGLLLASKLAVSLKDLIFIFLLRTIITLPIIVAISHIIF
ncbi:YjiH family protein [Paraliobacillus quinghaiensis]|nr:YjiH family protein [Paraliobacillus quinghaiensis]